MLRVVVLRITAVMLVRIVTAVMSVLTVTAVMLVQYLLLLYEYL